jgi:hypothetical protein
MGMVKFYERNKKGQNFEIDIKTRIAGYNCKLLPLLFILPIKRCWKWRFL